MSGKSVLIIGGRSDMGLAIAHRFAKAGYAVQLAARNAASLTEVKSDLEIRHQVAVSLHELNILQSDRFESFIGSLPVLPDVAVSVVGLMGDQSQSEKDAQAATVVLRSNFEGPALLSGLIVNHFIARGHGTLVGVSSVAGDRGRASNYVYGSSKAGYTAFLSGLRNRVNGTGVNVLTVKPGFVATRMTENLDLPRALTASTEHVAEDVFKAVGKGRRIIYTKWIWRYVMLIIKHIPEFVFVRLKL